MILRVPLPISDFNQPFLNLKTRNLILQALKPKSFEIRLNDVICHVQQLKQRIFVLSCPFDMECAIS